MRIGKREDVLLVGFRICCFSVALRALFHTSSIFLIFALLQAIASETMANQRTGSLEDWSSAQSSSDPNYNSKTHHEPQSELRLRDPRMSGNYDAAEHHESISQIPGRHADAEQPPTDLGIQKTSSNLYGTRAKLGLHPTAPIIHEHDIVEAQDWWWPRVRLSLKEPFAEVSIPIAACSKSS